MIQRIAIANMKRFIIRTGNNKREIFIQQTLNIPKALSRNKLKLHKRESIAKRQICLVQEGQCTHFFFFFHVIQRIELDPLQSCHK